MRSGVEVLVPQARQNVPFLAVVPQAPGATAENMMDRWARGGTRRPTPKGISPVNDFQKVLVLMFLLVNLVEFTPAQRINAFFSRQIVTVCKPNQMPPAMSVREKMPGKMQKHMSQIVAPKIMAHRN